MDGNGSVALDKSKRERATKNLEMALAGESAEHISRVLSLVVKFGIDPDEEFFLLIAAIGHLKVLVEDAPNQWQDLFESFQGELGQWAQNNTEYLRQLESKTQTIEALAQSCSKLSSTLELLQIMSEAAIEPLKNSALLSKELKGVQQELGSFRQELMEWRQEQSLLREEMNSINCWLSSSPQTRGIKSLEAGGASSKKNLWETAAVVLAGTSLLISGAGIWAYLGWDRPIFYAASSGVGYLLKQQNKRDCKDGLYKSTDPACRTLKLREGPGSK